MALRIRKVKDETKFGWHYVALCAAESEPKRGDRYLNDGEHEVLDKIFYEHFKEMGFIREKKEI
jgi:hypothetical protein